MPDFIDVQCFAGGMTLGVVQAGWRLVAKREQRGGFGEANCLANRHLLGESWDSQACDPGEWQPYKVDLVASNPPCSAFSGLTSSKARGMDSPINECMKATMQFASQCDPDVIVMESVQQAYTQGRPLMQQLRATVEERTGKQYGMFNVLHNNVMVGGAAERRRYFLVLSRVPFGVESVPITRLVTLSEAIGDLMPLGLTWGEQPHRSPASWWAQKRRRSDGLIDGHMIQNDHMDQRRSQAILDSDVPWYEGEDTSAALRRYYETHGDVPELWRDKLTRLLERDFDMGFSQSSRWSWNRPAHVITGGGMSQIHPVLPRQFTHREVARILGFPDDWRINPLRNVKGLPATWGKGVSVDCGRWIGEWALNSLEGNPGSDTGECVGDREWTINHTNIWRHLRSKRIKQVAA